MATDKSVEQRSAVSSSDSREDNRGSNAANSASSNTSSSNVSSGKSDAPAGSSSNQGSVSGASTGSAAAAANSSSAASTASSGNPQESRKRRLQAAATAAEDGLSAISGSSEMQPSAKIVRVGAAASAQSITSSTGSAGKMSVGDQKSASGKPGLEPEKKSEDVETKDLKQADESKKVPPIKIILPSSTSPSSETKDNAASSTASSSANSNSATVSSQAQGTKTGPQSSTTTVITGAAAGVAATGCSVKLPYVVFGASGSASSTSSLKAGSNGRDSDKQIADSTSSGDKTGGKGAGDASQGKASSTPSPGAQQTSNADVKAKDGKSEKGAAVGASSSGGPDTRTGSVRSPRTGVEAGGDQPSSSVNSAASPGGGGLRELNRQASEGSLLASNKDAKSPQGDAKTGSARGSPAGGSPTSGKDVTVGEASSSSAVGSGATAGNKTADAADSAKAGGSSNAADSSKDAPGRSGSKSPDKDADKGTSSSTKSPKSESAAGDDEGVDADSIPAEQQTDPLKIEPGATPTPTAGPDTPKTTDASKEASSQPPTPAPVKEEPPPAAPVPVPIVDAQHPRKRKLRAAAVREAASAGSGSAATSSASSTSTTTTATTAASTSSLSTSNIPPVVYPSPTAAFRIEEQSHGNPLEIFARIRRHLEIQRRQLVPVHPKPPQGYRDYLIHRGTYVLDGNPQAQLAAATQLSPPPGIMGIPALRDLFVSQENERAKLRLRHLVEKEKLVLCVEQEILRVHGRAARALANQALPFSACTMLRDAVLSNPPPPPRDPWQNPHQMLCYPSCEEGGGSRDRSGFPQPNGGAGGARSRYNGRLFLSWLQDVDDKWEKIKSGMVLRHHNEAEALQAVQKMDWEFKLQELGMVGGKDGSTASLLGLAEKSAKSPKMWHPVDVAVDDVNIPIVHVSDDFDLLPA